MIYNIWQLNALLFITPHRRRLITNTEELNKHKGHTQNNKPCQNEEEPMAKRSATSVFWKWFGYEKSETEKNMMQQHLCSC